MADATSHPTHSSSRPGLRAAELVHRPVVIAAGILGSGAVALALFQPAQVWAEITTAARFLHLLACIIG